MSSLNVCKNLSVDSDTSVSGSISTVGNILGGTISGNTVSLRDGANLGTITQVSTELTLSSSGNRVAIANGSVLVFKNDSTTQLSSYTANEIVDDCDIFTSLYNIANPSNLRYALSSTFALNQSIPTTITISANTIYAYPIRLVKGQVVNGAAFYFASVSGTPSITYGLYSTANPAARLAVTAATTPTATVQLIAFSSAYTVPTTGIYYVCLFASSIGSGLSMVGMAANSYMNYGRTLSSGGGISFGSQNTILSGTSGAITGIAVNADKNRLVLCIYGGTIQYSTFNGSTWSAPTNTLNSTNRNWTGIAMSGDGSRIAMCVDPGLCYYSTWNGSNYTNPTQTLETTQRNYPGLDMTSDGSRIVVPGSGKIYFATWNGSNYTAFTQTLDTSITAGPGLGMTNDGSRIAYFNSSNPATLYIADWNGTNYGTSIASLSPSPYQVSGSGGVSALTSVTGSTTDRYLSFTSGTSSLILNRNIICDILIVGGGGGGGMSVGSGGGGGGIIHVTNYTLSAGTYTITVGNGGSPMSNVRDITTPNGGNSTFTFPNGTTLTALGGAIGNGQSAAFSDSQNSKSGGCGAGGVRWRPTGGSSTQTTSIGIAYGNHGGNANANDTANYGAGGGGGGGAAGSNGTSTSGGNGGAGRLIYITNDTTGTYYAGGGGGSVGQTSGQGLGGIGGGGNASNNTNATSGTANTGGGGGGLNQPATGITPGSGGSGVVIVRFKSAFIFGSSRNVKFSSDYSYLFISTQGANAPIYYVQIVGSSFSAVQSVPTNILPTTSDGWPLAVSRDGLTVYSGNYGSTIIYSTNLTITTANNIGVLSMAAQTAATAGGLAATLSGLTMTLSNQVAYALAYSL